MKILVETTEKKEIDIPVPSFWISSDKEKVVALLSETTALMAVHWKNAAYAYNANPDMLESEIRRAYENFAVCTEKEFFDIYESIVEAISFKPVLKEMVSGDNYLDGLEKAGLLTKEKPAEL